MTRDFASPLPKRFYTEVTTASMPDGWQVLLDGRVLKTVIKKPLLLPNAALADAVAAEWREVEQAIHPDRMPLTRLANIALDRMGQERRAVMENAMLYADTDLLCHRAHEPELRALQVEHWDPVLHALENHGIRMVTTYGVIPVLQPQESLDAIRGLLEGASDFEAAALAMLTPLLGSVLLTLAVWKRHIRFEAALEACRLDETYQQSQWGTDAEADALWQAKARDLRACATWLALLEGK